MIERSLTFAIDGKSFNVQFPNVGQIITMESRKMGLTENRYSQMATSGLLSMFYALDIVDAISFYQVCCPEVGKFFDIINYSTLSPDKIQPLIDAYTNEIRPWYNRVMNELRKASSEKETQDE